MRCCMLVISAQVEETVSSRVRPVFTFTGPESNALSKRALTSSVRFKQQICLGKSGVTVMSLDFSLTQNADSAHYTDSSSLSDAPDEHFKIDATLCEFSIIQQNLIALLIGSLWPWEGVMAGFLKFIIST